MSRPVAMLVIGLYSLLTNLLLLLAPLDILAPFGWTTIDRPAWLLGRRIAMPSIILATFLILYRNTPHNPIAQVLLSLVAVTLGLGVLLDLIDLETVSISGQSDMAFRFALGLTAGWFSCHSQSTLPDH